MAHPVYSYFDGVDQQGYDDSVIASAIAILTYCMGVFDYADEGFN